MSVRRRRVRRLVALIALLVANPAAAEVMDKEPTIGAIWQSVLVAVAIACIAAVIQRWLLLASFLVFVPSAAVFAWAECHNAHVGPAIFAEAGPGYALAANAAVAFVLAAHVGLWFLASWWRSRRQNSPDAASSYTHLRSLAFTIALVLLLALASTSGFGVELTIVWSAPFLVGAASVLTTAVLWWAGRSRPGQRAAV
jgi:hypothetical protein